MTYFIFFFGIAVCFFEMLMIYTLCKAFLERRFFHKYPDFLLLSGFTFILFMINQMHNPHINVIATVSITFLICLLMFHGSTRTRIYTCSMACLILFATEHVGFRILGNNISNHRLIPVITITMIIKLVSFTIIEIICCKAKSQKIHVTGERTIISCFFLYPVSCFILLLGLRYGEFRILTSTGEIVLIIGLCFLLFSNMLLFFLYDYMIYISNQIREYELDKAKDQLTQQHFSIIQKTNLKYTSLLHEVNNYVKTMQTLQLQGNADSLKETSAALMSELSDISNDNYCSSPIINAILHEKKQFAVEQNIDFQIFVEPYFPTPAMDDHDLISLLCNILDNAIEAAAACPSGHIKIQCFVNGSFQVFHVQNSFNHKLQPDHNRFFTSKTDKTRHGFGMKRMEYIVEKYHGTLTCTPDDNTFTVTALIPLVTLDIK